MQSEKTLFDDLVRLATGAAGALGDVKGEVEARVRALARRAGASEVPARCGNLMLDRAGQRVLDSGRPLDLTRAEFMVLAALIERAGKVVPKAKLFDQLYDWETETGLSAVEVFVSRIRRKIDRSGVRIRTVRGLGYLLEDLSSPAGNQRDGPD